MNQMLIAGAIVALVVVISFLFKVLTKGKGVRRKSTDLPEETKPGKTGSRKISNWMGWIIVVVIISGVFAFVYIAPKYLKKGGKEKSVTSPIYAISEWKKKPEQYGTNPEKRKSGPMDTTITRRTGGVFNFKINYKDRNGNNRLAKFEGEYKGDSILKNTEINGAWRQDYPTDYGDWFLVSVDGDRFFEGWFTGRTGEEIPFFLKIKKE